MSTENITAFFTKAQTDPTLAEKLALASAQAIADVAAEAGHPFTAEEFLAHQTELSDASLTEVAGGGLMPPSWHSKKRPEPIPSVSQD